VDRSQLRLIVEWNGMPPDSSFEKLGYKGKLLTDNIIIGEKLKV
jgi:hypothetical protein